MQPRRPRFSFVSSAAGVQALGLWLRAGWARWRARRAEAAHQRRLAQELLGMSEREMLDLAIGRGEIPHLLQQLPPTAAAVDQPGLPRAGALRAAVRGAAATGAAVPKLARSSHCKVST